ncbi:MAG TPA: hypothetical protein VD962_09460 [Rubricoccaceae bacterium]|nr:hypothetical protein [Rubricoccaceae bacterium]
MPLALTDADLDRLAAALGAPAEREGSLVRIALTHAESGRRLAVEIVPALALPGGPEGGAAALVSVYGPAAFVQLQGCTGFVASEELGEVIFFAREGGRVSGLVIEREAGCSLYANVAERLLSADFTQLPPEVMMSAVALSMSEPLFE